MNDSERAWHDVPERISSSFLRVYDPLQTIFREGDPGDVMYVVEDGQVTIRKESAGDPVRLTALGKGELFGEVALVDRSPRSASAIAGAQGAKVLAIDRAHFVYLVSQQPAFALVVLEVMASRLRSNIHYQACADET